jgi:hypothetical protein
MGEKPNATPDPWFEVRELAVGQAVDCASSCGA